MPPILYNVADFLLFYIIPKLAFLTKPCLNKKYHANVSQSIYVWDNDPISGAERLTTSNKKQDDHSYKYTRVSAPGTAFRKLEMFSKHGILEGKDTC